MLEFLLFVGGLAVVIPAAMYVAGRMGGRDVWGLLLRGYEKRGAGAYRAQLRPVWVAGKPPLSVHFAAITSFILGQMVIPGALAALIGLVACLEILSRGFDGPGDWLVLILMLSSPTGLIIAARLLKVGLGLLQRADGSAKDARDVARFSIIHNVVLLVSFAVVYILAKNDAVYLPAIYACFSIAHALLLRKAARDIDAHGLAEERDREIALRPPQLADRPA